MAAAEVCVTGSVWSQDPHDEAVYVENDSIAVELSSLRILQRDGQLLQLGPDRQLDEAASCSGDVTRRASRANTTMASVG